MSIINKITVLFGIACFTILAYEGIQVMKHSRSVITVYGLADKVVTSDRAVISLKFTENGNNINDVNEKLSKNEELICKFLNKHGIDTKEIQEDNVEIQDNYYEYYYNNKDGKIPEIRYKITKTLIVDTDKVDVVKSLPSKITSLLKDNIFVTTNIKYFYTKFDALKLDLIGEAAKDAMDRAKHIEKVTGCNLKKIRNLSTGKFNILDGSNTRADNENWSDGENAYKKRYRVIVNVTYDKD